MNLSKKIVNSIIYSLTKKPSHYVHIDNPKTLQEYRQVQYNNWCRAKGVYNGSYLPKNPNKLCKSGKKGWFETKGKPDKSIRNFQRKSSGQRVRFDDETVDQIAHYHWMNPYPTIPGHKLKTIYLDRYGKPCTENDDLHHLAPLDAKCPKKALKKYLL